MSCHIIPFFAGILNSAKTVLFSIKLLLEELRDIV